MMPGIHPQDSARDSGEHEQLHLVQGRFGPVAQAYATSAVHALGPDLNWIVEAAALTGKEQVIDVATGAGHTAFALAPYAGEVIALDITMPMLQAAQRLASERGVTNIRFLEGDALALPLASSSIDLVACRHAAHHFSPVSQAVREWVRVLKPEGKLILADSIAPEEPELDIFLNELEVLRDSSHVRNYPISEWLTLLREAGLTPKLSRAWGIPLDVPSWTQRIQTPPEDVERIMQRLADASTLARERFHIENINGSVSFTLPAALFVGVKSV